MSISNKVVIVHHSEIVLKGKNRAKFENKLVENIRRKIKDRILKIMKVQARIVVVPRDENSIPEIIDSLKKTFGIRWISVANECESKLESIKSTVLDMFRNNLRGTQSFEVVVKRADKSFPLTSIQLEKEIGKLLTENFPSKVNFKNPESRIFIEITSNASYVYTSKIPGPGGLPVGIAGKAISLISGGIDSPVASWLALKRGSQLVYLHFHPYESSKVVLESKIKDLIEVLSQWGSSKKLYLASSNEFLLKSLTISNPKYNLYLFKRLIFRTAEEIAKIENAKAIVVGDSLSQKASQTFEAMRITDYGISIPVLRPLLGYDKEETVEISKKLGLYNISIREYKDCCSLMAKHPATRPRFEIFKKLEEEIELEKIVEKTLKNVEVFEL